MEACVLIKQAQENLFPHGNPHADLSNGLEGITHHPSPAGDDRT